MTKKSRRNKLISVISSMMVAGFLLTTLISYQLARTSMCEQIVSTSLPLTSDNIYSELQRDLVRPIFISSLMAQDTFVRDWIIGGEKGVDQITKYLKEIRSTYDTHSCFLVSDTSHTYYYPDGILKEVRAEAEADQWYFRVREMEDLYETNVDPDLGNENSMTIFINYKVFDYDSNYIGATGVGLEVGALRDVIKQYGEKYRRNVYLTDRSGRIVLSGNSEYANIAEIEGMNAIADQVIAGNGGAFDYRSDGQRVFLHSRFVKELDWYLLVEEREGIATQKISRALFLNLIICGLITLGVVAVTVITITLYERAGKELEETITSQHEQLKLKNEQLAEAGQKKNLLLHILCHDLANPFGALISSLNLVENDPDMLPSLLPEINKSLSNGMGTIELVRKMRALEEGKINLPLQSVRLEPLIQESLTMLKNIFIDKGIHVKLDVADDLAVWVEKVSFNNSVLNNLLTNAVKFSEKGSDVRICATRTGSEQVKLTIADDGIGMPDTISSALFNLKGNVTRAGTNGELGTGFGMPLVEQIIKMYGGRIEVNSRDIAAFPNDHGTEIVLILNS